jgi:myosin heavy subunit
LANHQTKSTEIALSGDHDSFEASTEGIYVPDCITKENEKSELRSLAQSTRHHMHALQTSAAKICSDMARAKQLFGENQSKFFMQYALANFFARGNSGAIISTESRRRRIDDWVQKGKLINDYFEKTGIEDIDRFSKLTMAALTSLCKAPEDVVQDVLSNPAGVKAVEIDQRVALINESGKEVASELAAVKQELKQVKEQSELNYSEYQKTLAEAKQRIDFQDESLDLSNKQLNDAGGQMLSLRREVQEAKDEVARLKANGGSASQVRAAEKKVNSTEEEQRSLGQEIKRLRTEAEQLKSKVGSMKEQVAVRESIVNTVAQLKGDIQSMLSKYPVALRMKMQQVDPEVTAVLDEIASDLHALADQLKPSSSPSNPHNKVMPISVAALSDADVMEA